VCEIDEYFAWVMLMINESHGKQKTTKNNNFSYEIGLNKVKIK